MRLNTTLNLYGMVVVYFEHISKRFFAQCPFKPLSQKRPAYSKEEILKSRIRLQVSRAAIIIFLPVGASVFPSRVREVNGARTLQELYTKAFRNVPRNVTVHEPLKS